MNKRIIFNNIFRNRKVLLLIFCIVIVGICTLTIAYSALSIVLNIDGNAEVMAANWDIHFENVIVDTGSFNLDSPVVSKNKVSFSTELNKPGDYYKFTIDVVNDGTIDAMISEIVKTPELTEEQAKYIKYVVSYVDNSTLELPHSLKAGDTKKLKVEVMFRTDLENEDLPTSSVTLNLGFYLTYMQANEDEGYDVVMAPSYVQMLTGNIKTVGSEFKIGNEEFMVMWSDGDTVSALGKYNLQVGGSSFEFDTDNVVAIENPTGLQDSNCRGFVLNESMTCVLPFADSEYWSDYPSISYGESLKDVYDSNSLLYPYLENYKNYLIGLGADVIDSRVISVKDYNNIQLQFDSIYREKMAMLEEYIINGSFWLGLANEENVVVFVPSLSDDAELLPYYVDYAVGIRPVIEIRIN